MKRSVFLLLSILSIISNKTVTAQVLWTENFNAVPCSTGCRAGSYTSSNGTWTETVTGTQGAHPNAWFVSCAENAGRAGTCGTGCNSSSPSNSLHIGNQSDSPNANSFCPNGDCGAFYDNKVITSIRAESPAIDLTNGTFPVLSFNYFEGGDGTKDNFTVHFYNGTTWVQLSDPLKTATCAASHPGKWTNYLYQIPSSMNGKTNFKIGFQWVNNDDGSGSNPSVAIDSIQIINSSIKADFGVSTQTTCTGGCLTYTDSSQNAVGPIIVWSWTFQGGTPSSYIGQNPPPICYPNAGKYNVQLYIQNSLGGSNTNFASEYIRVISCLRPIAGFLASSTGICIGDCVNFTDNTIGGTKPYTSWEWEFPGGNPATFSGQAPPPVCYSNEGLYAVKLKVKDTNGITDSLEESDFITVSNCEQKPEAAFSGSKTLICENECISFTDLSVGDPDMWRWTFDGAVPNTSTDQNPQNICYSTTGFYDVELIASNSSGSDTTRLTSFTTVAVCTGMDHPEAEQELSIYPNPSRQYFTVTTNDNFQPGKALLYDVTGREMLGIDLAGGNSFQLNTEKLPPGVYSLNIIYKSGKIITKRLIRQN